MFDEVMINEDGAYAWHVEDIYIRIGLYELAII